MKQRDVWVYIEHYKNKIADVSLELLGKAHDLSNTLKSEVGAILVGHNVQSMIDILYEYGADKVYVIDHKTLEEYLPLPYTYAVVHLIKKYNPYIVLYGATVNGRDLAPRIASSLRTGLTADCTDLQIGAYQSRGKEYKDILYQIRPAFGGNIIATIVSPEHFPQMATVREGVMKKRDPQPGRKGQVFQETLEFPEELLVSKVLKKIKKERHVDLKSAPIIVAGGMGVGSKEGFDLLKELAHELGGEIAASRAAVDAGFISKEYQVGQTGTTVHPKLYIAVGISGAVQHIAGMKQSHRIIAINTDPDAPIFNIAHYGIVGDYEKVIPEFIETFRQMKK